MFQSTHSLRSATRQGNNISMHYGVSIHALLAECDWRLRTPDWFPGCFNPRTPCGVRLFKQVDMPAFFRFNPRTPCGVRRPLRYQRIMVRKFQSTHSLRSATSGEQKSGDQGRVSIHALLAECDRFTTISPSFVRVSIHALLAECDGSVQEG